MKKFNLEEIVREVYNRVYDDLSEKINTDEHQNLYKAEEFISSITKRIHSYTSTDKKAIIRSILERKRKLKVTDERINKQVIVVHEVLFCNKNKKEVAREYGFKESYINASISDFRYYIQFKTWRYVRRWVRDDRYVALQHQAIDYYQTGKHIPVNLSYSVSKLFELFPSQKLQAKNVRHFTFKGALIITVTMNFEPNGLWLFCEDLDGGLKIGGVHIHLRQCSPMDLLVLLGKQYFECDHCEEWIRKRVSRSYTTCNTSFTCNRTPTELGIKRFDELCEEFCNTLKKHIKEQYTLEIASNRSELIKEEYQNFAHQYRMNVHHLDTYQSLSKNERYMLLDFLQINEHQMRSNGLGHISWRMGLE